MGKAAITYIDHSGFLLETAEAAFLFDYYRGNIPSVRTDKPLVVFVSHRHPDHYNPVIFDLLKTHPDTHFVIAKGVPVKRQTEAYRAQGTDLAAHMTIMRKNETCTLPLSSGADLIVTTLRSTDEGVAWLLACGGKTYYHAGDLNLWVWEGEPEQDNAHMTRAFFVEMEKLRGKHIDVAFVPLDPRQEKDAFGGMEAFLDYTDTRWAVPMHMWGQYSLTDDFLKMHPEAKDQMIKITKNGQVTEVEV